MFITCLDVFLIDSTHTSCLKKKSHTPFIIQLFLCSQDCLVPSLFLCIRFKAKFRMSLLLVISQASLFLSHLQQTGAFSLTLTRLIKDLKVLVFKHSLKYIFKKWKKKTSKWHKFIGSLHAQKTWKCKRATWTHHSDPPPSFFFFFLLFFTPQRCETHLASLCC